MNSKLMALVKQNLSRTRTTSIVTVTGVALAMGLYVFCTGLVQGVRDVVFEKVFIQDAIEVMPQKVTVGIFENESGPNIDTKMIEELLEIEGVKGVYPRMSFGFPANYTGSISTLVNEVVQTKVMKDNGRRITFEIVADGVAPEMIAPTLRKPEAFKDLTFPISCDASSPCPQGLTCDTGTCMAEPCSPALKSNQCPVNTYCSSYSDQTQKIRYRCEPPVPAVISEHLLEMYNGGLAKAMNLPRISKEITDAVAPVIPLTLGTSFMARGNSSKQLTKYIQLVGISKNAIAIGLTLPLGHVVEFNRILRGETVGDRYHTLTVLLHSPRDVERVKAAVLELGLALGDDVKKAEQAAKVLRTAEFTLLFLAVLILFVVAINLSQTFLLLVRQRRRELGLFRSLGATRWMIQQLILTEAAILGLTGAAIGAISGVALANLVDLSLTYVPYFPYKPDSLFSFELGEFILVFAASVIFCVGGAFWPARHAANLSPASALKSL